MRVISGSAERTMNHQERFWDIISQGLRHTSELARSSNVSNDGFPQEVLLLVYHDLELASGTKSY